VQWDTLRLGQPVRLFDLRVARADGAIAQYSLNSNSATRYDVMPDGQHFVISLAPPSAIPPHYDVIVNWFEEVKRPTTH